MRKSVKEQRANELVSSHDIPAMMTSLEQMKTDLQQSIFFYCPWQVDIRYDIKWQAWKRQIPQKVLTAPFLTSSLCLFF
jgi:hypothetical protein